MTESWGGTAGIEGDINRYPPTALWWAGMLSRDRPARIWLGER